MELNGKQEGQLHIALIDAYPNVHDFVRMLRFELDIAVSAGIRSSSDVIFDIIVDLKAKGKLSVLIEAAHHDRHENPKLQDFYEQVWLPLINTQSARTTSATIRPDTRGSQGSIVSPKEQAQDQPPPVIDFEQRRQSITRKTRSEDASVERETLEDQKPDPLPFPKQRKSSDDLDESDVLYVREHIGNARETVESILELFRPENEIFEDDCQFAATEVQATGSTVENAFADFAGVLSTFHSPACSLLKNEQASFRNNVGKAIFYCYELAKQTSSLPLRKEVWERLQGLLKSLDSISELLETLNQLSDST